MIASDFPHAPEPAAATGSLDVFRPLVDLSGAHSTPMPERKKKEETPCHRHRRFAPSAHPKTGSVRRFARTVTPEAQAPEVPEPPVS